MHKELGDSEDYYHMKAQVASSIVASLVYSNRLSYLYQNNIFGPLEVCESNCISMKLFLKFVKTCGNMVLSGLVITAIDNFCLAGKDSAEVIDCTKDSFCIISNVTESWWGASGMYVKSSDNGDSAHVIDQHHLCDGGTMCVATPLFNIVPRTYFCVARFGIDRKKYSTEKMVKVLAGLKRYGSDTSAVEI